MNLLQDRASRGRHPQLAAKLELTAGPLEEHHKLRGDRHRQVAAMILLDRRYREVQARARRK
jgi:hypothetical protein